MLLTRIANWVYKRYYAQLSFSQCGEDIFLRRTLARLGITNGTYLDIGANDPRQLNNTYLLYLQGFSGVLVEPNPDLAARLRRIRPRDHVIQAGIAAEAKANADFFIMSNTFFHTFSKKEADRIQQEGTAKILDIITVPLYSINDIITRYCSSTPNLISLDAEGMDEEIIAKFDFSQFHPELFCVERIDQTNFFNNTQNHTICEIMHNNGYIELANLHINSIFVNQDKWGNRHHDS